MGLAQRLAEIGLKRELEREQRNQVTVVEEKTNTTTALLPLLGGPNSSAGVRINQTTAVGISTVYACTSIRSKDVARCRPRLMKEKRAEREAGHGSSGRAAFRPAEPLADLDRVLQADACGVSAARQCLCSDPAR
jgi:phage portal protein BeeE